MERLATQRVEQIKLPQAGQWASLDDVAAFARECMVSCGLSDWAFAWDRAVRRLGCCKMSRCTISLSRFFAEHYLTREPELIRRTVLHELAHALAWVHQRSRDHGAAWRAWCAALGIAGEKAACACEDFASSGQSRRQPKYALCHAETGEIYRYYMRCPGVRPSKLKKYYIPGQKEHTLGKLCFISLENEAFPGSE